MKDVILILIAAIVFILSACSHDGTIPGVRPPLGLPAPRQPQLNPEGHDTGTIPVPTPTPSPSPTSKHGHGDDDNQGDEQ